MQVNFQYETFDEMDDEVFANIDFSENQTQGISNTLIDERPKIDVEFKQNHFDKYESCIDKDSDSSSFETKGTNFRFKKMKSFDKDSQIDSSRRREGYNFKSFTGTKDNSIFDQSHSGKFRFRFQQATLFKPN